MNAEGFNKAYQAVQALEPFYYVDEDENYFSGGPRLEDSTTEHVTTFVATMIELELRFNTLRYVFYVNSIPIAWIGSFGTMRVPPDEYRDKAPQAWDRYQRFIDDLTSPIAEGP